MDKKFVNLPKQYKNILNEIQYILNEEDIKKLDNKTIDFKKLNSLHNSINKICYNYDCNSFDINRMMHSYGKNHLIIDILQKISNLRNKYIVANSSKTTLWKDNLNNLKKNHQPFFKTRINNNMIEKSFIHLLKKYKYDWDGLWSIIDTNKKGDIRKIDVFDLDEQEEITNYLETTLGCCKK